MSTDILQEIARSVEEGDIRGISEIVPRALDEGYSGYEILQGGLLKGLDTLSNCFENSQVFIADLLQSSKVFKKGAELIKEDLASQGPRFKGRVVLATTEGDIHDIGKNLVRYVLECSGFEVIDLGVDVRSQEVIEAVRKYQPDVVALSATIISALFSQSDTVRQLRESDCLGKAKIVIGGAPTTDDFSEEIGADAHSKNLTDIATVINALLETQQA